MAEDNLLLQVKDLKLRFIMNEGNLQVVDGFNFHLERHKTLGLAGESGCGKSVCAAAILRANPPVNKLEGEIVRVDADVLMALRKMQMYSALVSASGGLGAPKETAKLITKMEKRKRR